MKHIILFLAVICAWNAHSQLNYTFSTSTVAFNSNATPTVIHAGGSNELLSASIAIGFTFNYNCVDYTTFQASTEGWLGLGAGHTAVNSQINNLSGVAERPKIAPLWDDIRVNSVGSVNYRLTGSAPNRILTVEWLQMRWNDGAGGANAHVMSCQARLFETTNVIQFNYWRGSTGVNSGSASIGLVGLNVGEFLSVNSAGTGVSSVTETNNINTKPVNDGRYTFTPTFSFVPCSGTPLAGTASSSLGTVNCSSPAVDFSVSGSSSGCGISYQWQSSPDGTSWTNISGATAVGYSQTVLATTYFRRVTTCSNSGISSNSNSVLVTYADCSVPIAGTLTPSTTTTTCTVATVSFTVAGGSTGCGISYQWQFSTNNIIYTNLMGETGASMTADILSTGYYRRTILCSLSGLSANSNSVLITNSGVAPINDLPCAASALTIGVPASGSNICSNNEFEPATPSCWTGGNVNTVWYSFVAPTSGQVKIKTIIQATLTVLQRTQIALYSGTCSNLTEIACNQNAPTCNAYVPQNSEITFTTLTPGVTYYISVDGKTNEVGDFSILVIDGTGNFPTVVGQDCGIPFSLCNPTTTIGNPGYQAIGGICDHSSGNCTNGEANSIWYTITINPALVGSQVMTFDIVPNDYGNPNPLTGAANPGYTGPGTETDYDYVLWKVAGTGATNCAGIFGGAAPVICNFSGLGVTGATTSGNSPAAYPGFDGAYEVGPTVVANDVYLLVIQNFSNSTGGFSLVFPIGSPVVYTPPTTVYWTGGNFTSSYTATSNWGGCNAPACGINAFVTPSSSNQPILTAGTHSVENLTINSGAVLTLQSGVTLQVCGNFTNNGSLICQAGSTIEFIGTGVQTISGSFENSDAFFNFTVNKITGSVVLANNIDVDGNFLTTNNTSILNTAGNRVRIGGNFTNANGNSTFSNTGTTGTLGFTGSTAASYNQGSSQLDLNFVTMNKTSAATLTLNTDMFIKSGTGTLTLSDGKIITGSNRVDVANGTATSVNAGNSASYVVGNLYRTLAGTAGSYEFPLGTSANYERANVTFTTATTIPRLLTRFDAWSGAPNTIGFTECLGNYILPAQDMGLWTINASANPTSGTYNMNLYSTGVSNTAGASGWTIQKAASSAGPWVFNGTCAFSTVSVISRTAMNGFSVFGVAQSATPLPVELMDFTGYRYNEMNILKWTTASELNSAYFLLEKSRNGTDFSTLEKIPAQGNSTTPYEYASFDDEPFNGITYYRLKLVDQDDQSEYSKIIAISSEPSKELTIKPIFPNPGRDELNMEYSIDKETDLDLSLVDGSGRILKSENVKLKGNGVFTMVTKEIKVGVYLFIVTDNDGFKEVYSWVKK